jgi:meiotic recombination protein REC8, fungi type
MQIPSRRGSRLTSASPLLGKGIPKLPSLDIQDPTNLYSEAADFNNDELGLGGQLGSDEFELYGPSADADTQTVAQSQWVKETLEDEAHNFLEFLETQIDERGEEVVIEEALEPMKSITMEDLLPPASNTRVVGAQALLHILSLATKGLIAVQQVEAFGDIRMRVVRGLPGAAKGGIPDGEGEGEKSEE